LLALIGSPFIVYSSPVAGIGVLTGGIVALIIGIICVIGAKYVSQLAWGIILLVLGIIALGISNLGGILVIIGALLGLLSRV
jgi:hypothetical protein